MRCENRQCKKETDRRVIIRDERVGRAVFVHVCSIECAEVEMELRYKDSLKARMAGGTDVLPP